MNNKENFGRLVQRLRRENGWTVKDFIEKIGVIGEDNKLLSPSYISKVEIYNEIPQPWIIYRMAEIFGEDLHKFAEVAKEQKKEEFALKLEDRFSDDFVLYRKTKLKKNAGK